VRLSIWSPLPPAPSGVADYVAEALPALAARAELTLVVPDPAAVAPEIARRYVLRRPDEAVSADLDLYHLGNSPPHAYVYRAALERPGVVFLHDFSLHHLVLRETLGRGDRSAYLREMRRAYGDVGSFVGSQVARGLGGHLLPARYPLNERVLEASLGVVGLSEHVRARAAERLPPGWPVLHLPHHLALPLAPLPSRAEARRALGLPEDALILTAPGLATASKRLDLAIRTLGRLRAAFSPLRLVVAGGVDPELPLETWCRSAGVRDAVLLTGALALDDFVRHLCAADVVLSLRFPSHGEMSGALVRALGVGRPVLVTAGTPAAEEFPEGVVVPLDPGPAEEAELLALLSRLLGDASLRERLGRVARAYVHERHDLEATVARLCAFLEQVLSGKAGALRAIAQRALPPGSLLEYLSHEARWCAQELGLSGYQLGLEPLLQELTEGPRD
jgi:glycosyltransferase involved in cell wall biosynthesis